MGRLKLNRGSRGQDPQQAARLLRVGISVGISCATDNPLYIENMHETFSAHAADIAYENYFNQKPRHQFTPSNVNPKSAQKYKQLWGG